MNKLTLFVLMAHSKVRKTLGFERVSQVVAALPSSWSNIWQTATPSIAAKFLQ